jgi:DNA polymerase-3 subunit beta
MDITTTRAPLLAAVTAAARIAKPINKQNLGAMLEANGHLRIAATDATSTVNADVSCQVAKKGQAAIDAGRFAKAVAAMGDAIRITTKGDALTLSSIDGSVTLPTMPTDVFPPLAIPAATPFLTADAGTLAAWIADAAYAASEDKDRANVVGVMVELKDGRLRASATDGHRLAFSVLEAPNAPDVRLRLVPEATLEVLSLCTGDVALAMDGDRLIVAGKDIRAIVPLYPADNFPPVDQVVPQNPSRMRVNLASLRGAIDRALVVATDKSVVVNLELGAKSLTVILEGTGGSSRSEVPGEYDGKPGRVAMSAWYLGQAIKHAQGETIVLGYSDELGPFMVGDKAVVMPVRPTHG